MINVDDYNTLAVPNEVVIESNWPFPQSMLNPYNNCGAPGPVGFAILQGYYDIGNYSGATALALYNTSTYFLCTTSIQGNYGYLFDPNSYAANYTVEGKSVYETSVSLSFSPKGYFTGFPENSSFHNFMQGVYTILGADEWGKLILVHINVTSDGSFVATSASNNWSLSPTISSTMIIANETTVVNRT